MTRIVSNTSPLIVLAKAGMLKILPGLFSEVLLPNAVRDEIMDGPSDDPMRRALPDCGWLKVVKLDPPLSALAVMQLGKGEAEVIECASRQLEPHAVLVDDRAGRRAAQAMGLVAIGTLSVVASACRTGNFGSFDDAVDRLRSAGLYMSPELVDAVRKSLASG